MMNLLLIILLFNLLMIAGTEKNGQCVSENGHCLRRSFRFNNATQSLDVINMSDDEIKKEWSTSEINTWKKEQVYVYNYFVLTYQFTSTTWYQKKYIKFGECLENNRIEQTRIEWMKNAERLVCKCRALHSCSQSTCQTKGMCFNVIDVSQNNLTKEKVVQNEFCRDDPGSNTNLLLLMIISLDESRIFNQECRYGSYCNSLPLHESLAVICPWMWIPNADDVVHISNQTFVKQSTNSLRCIECKTSNCTKNQECTAAGANGLCSRRFVKFGGWEIKDNQHLTLNSSGCINSSSSMFQFRRIMHISISSRLTVSFEFRESSFNEIFERLTTCLSSAVIPLYNWEFTNLRCHCTKSGMESGFEEFCKLDKTCERDEIIAKHPKLADHLFFCSYNLVDEVLKSSGCYFYPDRNAKPFMYLDIFVDDGETLRRTILCYNDLCNSGTTLTKELGCPVEDDSEIDDSDEEEDTTEEVFGPVAAIVSVFMTCLLAVFFACSVPHYFHLCKLDKDITVELNRLDKEESGSKNIKAKKVSKSPKVVDKVVKKSSPLKTTKVSHEDQLNERLQLKSF